MFSNKQCSERLVDLVPQTHEEGFEVVGSFCSIKAVFPKPMLDFVLEPVRGQVHVGSPVVFGRVFALAPLFACYSSLA